MQSTAQKEWSDIKTRRKNVPSNNAMLLTVFQEKRLHFPLFTLPAGSAGSFLRVCRSDVALPGTGPVRAPGAMGSYGRSQATSLGT